MDANFRTVKEARLSSPTNWVEISKVFAVARQELGETRAKFDNAVSIEAEVDPNGELPPKILLRWPVVL